MNSKCKLSLFGRGKNKPVHLFTKGTVLALLLISACTTFTACNEETEDVFNTQSKLNLKVQTAAIETRGLIESATLPDASQIGLMLVDASGTTYDTKTCNNIKATASTGKTPQTWTLDSQVLLSSTDGTLYGYYPYNSSVTDHTKVPVSAGETDYMYATPAEGLNDGSYNANVTMNHALAAIRLKIVRGTYTAAGSVTNLAIKGDNIATSATLNAKTGTLTSPTGAGTAINKTVTQTLSSSAQTTDFIFVPVTGSSAQPTFTATIDGKDYVATAGATSFAQGNLYEYTLTIDAKAITLSDVKVGDWSYNQSGNPVINAGYNITLAGDMEGIAFSNTINNDGSVTITALPVEENVKIKEVTCSSNATCTQTVGDNGRRTIVINNIQGDVTVTFNGLLKPVVGTIDLKTAANGVYAVAQNGLGVTVDDADESCIAVALIVNDAPVPQRLWIEKNGEANTTSIKAAYAADGASNTDYTLFYYGMYGTDIASIMNYTQVGGGETSTTGTLPKPDGSYISNYNKVSGDYKNWTGSYALNDWNGKANTAALIGASDTDSYTTYANMGTYASKFNATPSENQGYSDWYIPACGQISLMYLNWTEINKALEAIEGTNLGSQYYWSSSEYNDGSGWIFRFSKSVVGITSKWGTCQVRFVRDI